MRVLLVSLVLAACTSTPSVPSVELAVSYDDTWGLTELAIVAESIERVVPIQRELTLQIPDDWVDRAITISANGVVDGNVLAVGTTTITPLRDETVFGTVNLEFVKSKIPRPSDAQSIGDLASNGIDLTVPDGATFNTSTSCQGNTIVGVCTVVDRFELENACVCRTDSLVINNLTVTGDLAIVLLAWRSIEVNGQLVVKPGAGARVMAAPAGRGGSYGTRAGGTDAPPTWGTATLSPLVGGMGGGGTRGGRGGGAIQLVAGHSIAVDGSINAPGGGANNTSCSTSEPGAGGGSGGAILLEAPQVTVLGTLSANGGGGNGGLVQSSSSTPHCGGSGADGGLMAAAIGGYASSIVCAPAQTPFVSGGKGGDGSFRDGTGQSGAAPSGGGTCGGGSSYHGSYGGPGGGGGRIRINTAPGAACNCTTEISPSPSSGAIAYID